MPREVQLRRGSTADIAGFTGAEGELVYDTDLKILVVHDGVTPGGFPVVSDATLAFGNHVPAPTVGTNVSAATLDFGNYMRVGDRVHVSGHGEVDFVLGAATDSEFFIDLPIALAITNEGQVFGSCILEDGTPGQIVGDIPTDRAVILIKAPGTAAIKFTYSFDYLVL